MYLERSAKFLLWLLGSAIVALIFAFVFAAISLSGVTSMNAAGICLWIAFGVFAIALIAVAVIYCPGKSGTMASLATLGLVLILVTGLWGRFYLNQWLIQQKALQLATAVLPPPPLPKPPTVPKNWQPQRSGSGRVGGTRIFIKQTGSRNTANPGTSTGPVHVEPCGVFQNGGSNNTASPSCVPKVKISASAQTQQQTGNPEMPWVTYFTISTNVLVQTGDLKLKCNGPVLRAGISRINPASLITGSNGPNPNDPNEAIYELGPEMLSPGRVITIGVYSKAPVSVLSGSLGQQKINFQPQ